MPYKCRDCGTEVEVHASGEACIACRGIDFIETTTVAVTAASSISGRAGRGAFTRHEATDLRETERATIVRPSPRVEPLEAADAEAERAFLAERRSPTLLADILDGLDPGRLRRRILNRLIGLTIAGFVVGAFLGIIADQVSIYRFRQAHVRFLSWPDYFQNFSLTLQNNFATFTALGFMGWLLALYVINHKRAEHRLKNLREILTIAIIILPLGGLYFLNYLFCNMLFLADAVVADMGSYSQKRFWIILCTSTGAISSLIYAHRVCSDKEHKFYSKIGIVVVVIFSLILLF